MDLAVYIVSLVLIVAGFSLWLCITGHMWLGIALIFIGCLMAFYRTMSLVKKSGHKSCSKVLTIIVTVCVSLGMVYFAGVECMIISDAFPDNDARGEYIIVLGAGVNGTRPSLSLLDRLNTALLYMSEHPKVKAVVTGGKGDGEQLSEAECMFLWLTDHGIAEDRIVMEDKAESTSQNFSYASELIIADCGYFPEKTGVITAEYHMHRAKLMASAMGLEVSGIPAHTSLPTMMVSYFIREAFGVTHFYVYGD